MLTIKDVKKHIKYCKRFGKRYNWLGFVENKDLSPEVEALFSVGHNLWDWVKGNDKLRALEEEPMKSHDPLKKPGIGKRPKTDEEARAACHDCRNFNGLDTCSIEQIGLITVEARHICYLAGYMQFRSDYGSRGKYGRLPPCP